MSKLQDRKIKTLGSIAAVQTLLERYPVLLTTDSTEDKESLTVSFSAIGFLLTLLGMIGVNENTIIRWMAKLCSEKAGAGGQAALDVLETGVKVALEANIKGLFTCEVDPLLSDDLMYEYPSEDIAGQVKRGSGIQVNLDSVDLMGTLSYCPSDSNDSAYYFDSYESIYYSDEAERIAHGYTPNNLWKSMDFNAFLWYIINKGTIVENAERQMCTWDNRVRKLNEMKNSEEYREKFFTTTDKDEMTSIGKKQYVICEYVERSNNIVRPSNVLKIYLNADRYYHARSLMTGSGKKVLPMNRTIFEFNHDFIWSMKLFDTKTLVSAIMKAILGISVTGSLVNVSWERKQKEAQIRQIVRRIIEMDDKSDDENNTIDDSFFAFSNEEYDKLLSEADSRYNGTYQKGDYTYPSISSETYKGILSGITAAETTEEQEEAIAKAFESIATIVSQSRPEYGLGVSFSINKNIITQFIEELCTQLVLSILSPKMAILYAVNAKIMGSDLDDVNGWENFWETWRNLIASLVKTIKDLILEQLYQFLIGELKPLLELFINKILLETIRDYKDLIANLIRLCTPTVNISLGGRREILEIDNVNYADIIPEQTTP